MSDLFSVIASVLLIPVFVFYFKQVKQGTSTPNPATWFIWLVTTTMNSITYYYVVGGDLKFLVTVIVVAGVAVNLFYSFMTGKLTKPGVVEIVCFLLAIAVGFFWKKTGNEIASNLFLQGVIAIAFIPTINGLLKHKAKEKPLPWSLAVFAYLFQVMAVLTDWKNGGWVALALPVIIGIGCNGTVALLAYKQNKSQ